MVDNKNNEDDTARIAELEDAMRNISEMLLEENSDESILSFIDKEYPDVDKEQTLLDVKGIHELLKEQKASDKKIERVMERPIVAHQRVQHIKLMKTFILEIKDQAYSGRKSEDIKESLEKNPDYKFFMHSKNKAFISLRKSIPKLVKVVREMKGKEKTEQEIIDFLYKHLFSYIKF